MNTSINYLIAGSPNRATKSNMPGLDGKDILRKHLEELSKTNLDKIEQITILRPILGEPAEKNPDQIDYWRVDEIVAELKLKCRVEILDVKNVCHSYSSWIQAVQKYRDLFAYYIMIEDDYYPACVDFAPELLRLHQKKLPGGGFLNSFTTCHAAISNGIGDSKTFIQGMELAKPDPIKAIASAAQRLFGKIIFRQRLADYSDEYRSLYWDGVSQSEWTHDVDADQKRDIFRPVQYLILGESIIKKIVKIFEPEQG